jgi:phosphatidate cytidylyltransferase
MTRVLSGAMLIALAVVVVWLAPPIVFLAAAEGMLLLAFGEYAGLARAGGVEVLPIVSGAAAALTCAAFAPVVLVRARMLTLDGVLMSAFVAVGLVALLRWRGGSDALTTSAASLFPVFYLGLPFGSMVAVRETRGSEALFLFMLTVIVSDTAQYYSGRAFGRNLLAPAVSPKKTVEGALGGIIGGGLLLLIVGHWWLPGTAPLARALLGLIVVALGIAGDLFESMLKRGAGVKDSSSLIPGHGGVLDRIDALLFAAPIYYVALKYV